MNKIKKISKHYKFELQLKFEPLLNCVNSVAISTIKLFTNSFSITDNKPQFFDGKSKIVIASSGRSGSTMLFNSIADSLIKQRFNIMPNGIIWKIVKRQCSGFVDRIDNLSSSSYTVCKTHDLFENPQISSTKYIFIYGDPLESAMSVEQVVENYGEGWFRQHQYHLKAKGFYCDLYEKDVLNYEGQLISWLSQSEENVLCIDYLDLWEKVHVLSHFLGFEINLPPKLPRNPKTSNSKINYALFARLRDLKVRFKEQYES